MWDTEQLKVSGQEQLCCSNDNWNNDSDNEQCASSFLSDKYSDLPVDYMNNKHYFSDDSDGEQYKQETYNNFERETKYTDETYKKIQRGREIYNDILSNLKPWLPYDIDWEYNKYYYHLIPFQNYDKADIITAIYAPKDTVFYIIIEDNILYSNDTEYIGDTFSNYIDKINNEKQLEDILNMKNLRISQTGNILKMSRNINTNDGQYIDNYTFGTDVININGKEYHRHVIGTPFLPCYSMPRLCISSKFLNSMLYIENVIMAKGISLDPYIISIRNRLYYNNGWPVPLQEDDNYDDIPYVDEYEEKYRGHAFAQDLIKDQDDYIPNLFNLTTVSFETWGNRELDNKTKNMYHNLFTRNNNYSDDD